MLVDHKGGYLDESYLRLTEEEILSEYMKAEPFLTLDPTMKMQQEIQTLRVQKSEMDLLTQKMQEYDKILGLT